MNELLRKDCFTQYCNIITLNIQVYINILHKLNTKLHQIDIVNYIIGFYCYIKYYIKIFYYVN